MFWEGEPLPQSPPSQVLEELPTEAPETKKGVFAESLRRGSPSLSEVLASSRSLRRFVTGGVGRTPPSAGGLVTKGKSLSDLQEPSSGGLFA